jgi:hypothetical protein
MYSIAIAVAVSLVVGGAIGYGGATALAPRPPQAVASQGPPPPAITLQCPDPVVPDAVTPAMRHFSAPQKTQTTGSKGW